MEKLSNKLIKEFIETAPLYSWREYKMPDEIITSLGINEIDAYCETCQQNRPFQDRRPSGAGAIGSRMSRGSVQSLSTGTSYFSFSCVSCSTDKHEYFVEKKVTDSTIKMQKYGELPRKKLDRDPLLQKFFLHDSDCYEKAVICIANGYGIAAFAYIRRIVESNIADLIDMLKEEIESTESESPLLIKLAELKKETHMSEKIKLANLVLPNYLVPSGLNPLGRLYQVLSEGVHKYSDEECLERAEDVRTCIKYLISELASRKKNRESFKGLVGKL